MRIINKDEKEHLIKLNKTATLESLQKEYNELERLINKCKIIRNGNQNIKVRFKCTHNIIWCAFTQKLIKILIQLKK